MKNTQALDHELQEEGHSSLENSSAYKLKKFVNLPDSALENQRHSANSQTREGSMEKA